MRKKLLLIFLVLCLRSVSGHAQISLRYPDDFTEGWTPYIGQTVKFTNRFYLIGTASGSSGYAEELLLAPSRLRTPDDVYAPGTPEHQALQTFNRENQITARCNSGKYGLLRTGNYIDNLTATVTGEKTLFIHSSAESLAWQGNPRPIRRPDLGEASLVVCGTNLQNYYPFYWRAPSGRYPSSASESARQNDKITSAMLNIDADIYGLAEVQDTCTAIEYLARSMNTAAGSPDKYGYITDYQPVSAFGPHATRTGYIYRTDKVRPVLSLGLPDPSDYAYSHRQYVQAFDETETGGRFILSINHFKAKGNNTESIRIANMTRLIGFLDIMEQIGYYDDNDVLVIGDLNAYSAEEPVRMLENKNYIDQLARFSPESYSYVYDNLVGNLDHALASSSLSPQITGAAPYLLNADEPTDYRWWGSLSSDDIYAYSDHNPILVGLRLTPDHHSADKMPDIRIPFATTLAPFTSYSVSGNKTWGIYADHVCAYISGYGEESANEDWLISPAFDLSRAKTAEFSFSHQIGHGGNSVQTHSTLWISNDYPGGPPAASHWEQLPITYTTDGYTHVTVDLPEKYLCAHMRIAFRYLSDEGENGVKPNWSVKDVRLKASDGQTPTECTDIDFAESFTQNTGEFTAQSVTGSQSWYWKSSNYGVVMSGYSNGNYENEDWLISPSFDLSDKSDPTLTFDHVINFCPSASALAANHTIWVSTGYTGGLPSSAEWTPLEIPRMPSGTSWNDWTSSGPVVIPEALRSKNVRFAFRYLSDKQTASTWEIKNLTFRAPCLFNALEEKEISGPIVSVNGQTIVITRLSNLPVAVYATDGRCLLIRYHAGDRTEIPVNQSGPYLVKTGEIAHKIFIR